MSLILYKLKYIIKYVVTLMLYKFRFGCVGSRTIIGKPLNWEYVNHVSIGSNVRILPLSRIEVIPSNENVNEFKVRVGDGVNIGHGFFLTCASNITIGDGVLISDNVAIIDNKHNHDSVEMSPCKSGYYSSPIVIGNNVTIYRCSTILSGVTIGDGAIIGAYSLVDKDIPHILLWRVFP